MFLQFAEPTIKERYRWKHLRALFNNVFAVGIVAGDNIVAVESDKQRVRLISESENLVTTLISGFKAGKPAINKTRDKMYFIDVKSAKVYILQP